jgi:hypothetical protein
MWMNVKQSSSIVKMNSTGGVGFFTVVTVSVLGDPRPDVIDLTNV